jgi:hypothetical protein
VIIRKKTKLKMAPKRKAAAPAKKTEAEASLKKPKLKHLPSVSHPSHGKVCLPRHAPTPC